MKRLLTFTVNGMAHRVEVEPTRRLIDVLRDDLSLTGTKEGCSIGVCGSCTVLVDGQVMSGCLTLAITLEGREIMTIEGLARGRTLHPLQRAFIDHGGFQCGFCTPGQIMAAYALLQEHPNASDDEIKEGMLGNLCRCTGYYKIIDSIKAAAAELAAPERPVIGVGVDYREAQTAEEACQLLDQYGDEGRLLAGGTAVVLLLHQRLMAPACLINIQGLAELGAIHEADAGIDIGALVTHSQAQRSPILRSQYPALAATFAKVATPRIRNAGTVGGNLAHGDPHLDPPVTLLALDATVTAQSSTSTREVALNEFFHDYYETALRPNEILSRVHIPTRAPDSGLAFMKFLPRSQDDYATVDLAAWVRMDANDRVVEARLALGSVGSVPFRAGAAESLLAGEPLTDQLMTEVGAAAAAAADPEDDVRGSAAYKRELIRVLVPRVLREAAADSRTAMEMARLG